MGWSFGWDALRDLLDRAMDEDVAAAISAPCWTPEAFKAHTIFVSEKWGDDRRACAPTCHAAASCI